jgi:hypothetical protein
MSCAVRYDHARYGEWRGPPRGMMRVGGIVLTVLGFIVWWPLGLAALAFLLWSKNMMCWSHHGADRWQRKMRRMEEKMERFYSGRPSYSSSGNRAFDEYREETLRRLEDEQREFHDFLDRLRAAKDKAEFDLFMAERRNSKPAAEPPQPQE